MVSIEVHIVGLELTTCYFKGWAKPLLWLSNAGIFVKLLGYLHLLPNHSVMNICTYIDLYIYQFSSTAQGGGGSFRIGNL